MFVLIIVLINIIYVIFMLNIPQRLTCKEKVARNMVTITKNKNISSES